MTLDLSALFHTSIGFDNLYKLLEETMNNASGSNYPPYNIVKISEQHYRIAIAVAGFEKDELIITLDDSLLKIIVVRFFLFVHVTLKLSNIEDVVSLVLKLLE